MSWFAASPAVIERRGCALFFGTGILLLIPLYFASVSAQDRASIAMARQMAGLALLPSSTTEVKVYKNAGFTWTEYYLMFTAKSEHIAHFLAASPGLPRTPNERF